MKTGFDEQRLLVKIARMYYEQDMTQARIAQVLDLSRQKVQRLLSQARDEGVVHILVRPVAGTYAELERALESRYGLREAVVVETTDYENLATIARELGAAGAKYLTRAIRLGDRVVMGWGSTLLETVNACFHNPRPTVKDVLIIQSMGGLGDANYDAHITVLTRRLADYLRGQGMILPAPGLAGTRKAQKAFVADPHISNVLEKARGANLALTGIGAPGKDSTVVKEGQFVSWPQLAQLAQMGAVGDINLRYFDEEGRLVKSELDERVIGLTLEELSKIDIVVAIAGGAVKFKAIQGALRGHFVNVLITDHVTAQKLLA